MCMLSWNRREASSFHSFEFPRSRPSPPVPVLLVLLAPTTLLPPPLDHSGGRTILPGGHPKRWDVAHRPCCTAAIAGRARSNV